MLWFGDGDVLLVALFCGVVGLGCFWFGFWGVCCLGGVCGFLLVLGVGGCGGVCRWRCVGGIACWVLGRLVFRVLCWLLSVLCVFCFFCLFLCSCVCRVEVVVFLFLLGLVLCRVIFVGCFFVFVGFGGFSLLCRWLCGVCGVAVGWFWVGRVLFVCVVLLIGVAFL